MEKSLIAATKKASPERRDRKSRLDRISRRTYITEPKSARLSVQETDAVYELEPVSSTQIREKANNLVNKFGSYATKETKAKSPSPGRTKLAKSRNHC